MNRRKDHDELVVRLIVALSATGLGRFWSQPTGAAYRGDAYIKYGIIGGGDISGIIKGGRRVEIEVKTGRGVQTDRQKSFEKMITGMGGLYLVARDVPTVLEKIKEASKEIKNA